MKKILYLFSLLLPVFMIVSCENNSDVPESKVTYFPRMELNGKTKLMESNTKTKVNGIGW